MEKYVECSDSLRTKINKHSGFVLLPYFAIWLLSVGFFWLIDGADAFAYSLIVIWILIPVTTFVTSFVTGFGNRFGKLKWLLPVLFGVMYMLLSYCTFGMANMIAFNKVNSADLTMLPLGAGISVFGIVAGALTGKLKNKI